MTATTDHYLGIDLHKREAQVAVLDDEGEVIEEVRVESSSLLPRERWAKAVSRRNDRILRRVARRLGFEPPSLVKSPMNDALNPNAHRISLLEEVQYNSFDVDLA